MSLTLPIINPVINETNLFNENQIKVLKALFSTFIAELDDNEIQELISLNNEKNISSIISFGKFDLSSRPEFLEYFLKRLNSLSEDKVTQIKIILNLLSSRPSSYLLTGYFKPFYNLTRQQREKVIQTWSISSNLFRNLYRSFSLLITTSFWIYTPKEIANTIGYPVIDPEINSKKFTSKINSFPTYEFIEIPKEGCELKFDIIVIGSGAGGGVVAAELAKAGNSVLVLEKGKYYHQNDLTTKATDGFDNLFEMKGTLASEGNNIITLAGSNFGGGTVVNWSASLRPQDFLKKEWAEQGLDYFLSDEFNDAIDYVEKRIGVSSSQIVHNEQNKILIEGCKNLGIHYANVPQNTGKYTHSCGWCCFGCKYGEKQSTLMTFLQDARDAGAKFIQDCYVEKILIKNDKAIGVKAIVSSDRILTVLAKKVVVSAGTINSPALLLRSNIKNINIGKNLHLHPVIEAYGVFPDREVKGYNGSILTSICSEKENIDGEGYGVKIETPALHPSFVAGGFPWKGSLHHKKLFLELNHLSTLIIIARDKDSGNVFIDDKGNPKIKYTLSKRDGFNLLQGVILALKILVAAGAKRVSTGQVGIEDFIIKEVGNVEEKSFLEYLKKVEKIGLPENGVCIGTAHQMSSCRMGINSSNSVVNPHGKVWQVDNLYIADASVFPTAVGVNPMITVMSTAYSIAQFIKKDDSQILAKL
ncbi:hypothetical protein C1645_718038 [Glomus cerebriforme]|uniref:Long-chain-alcohol oxidase n=1 Tax=Glomus cerebriforme TaxID=658196 RepID=A0A397TNK9_9GLOM|nr:hypothetical protein C1645_718038 [Glomus cerebriforme]